MQKQQLEFDGSLKPEDLFTPAQLHALKEEARLSFMAMWNGSQTDKSSPAYGLTFDRLPNPANMASLASTGYLLAAMPAAVEEGWVTVREARERTLLTMQTLINLDNFNGFFYHFVDMNTGRRSGNSEVSVIDTALLIGGVIIAGEYFLGEVKAKADEIYRRIDWNFYTYTEENGEKIFRMGFRPEKAIKDGKQVYTCDYIERKLKPEFQAKYDAAIKNGEKMQFKREMFDINFRQIKAGDDAGNLPDDDGFFGGWTGTSEQLMMYVLGSGAPNPAFRTPKRMYYDFRRPVGRYKDGPEFIYSCSGSLFLHQFSHAFVDFRNTVDEMGTDWFENSVKATLAAKYFAIDVQDMFPSYGENSWGLSACDTPTGYRGNLGAQPSEADTIALLEGTVPPYGAVASMPFAPKDAMAAFEHYLTIPGLNSPETGLFESFNISKEGELWVDGYILGIDKGITILMIMNYLNDGVVWENFMKSKDVQSGMANLGIRKKAIAASSVG